MSHNMEKKSAVFKDLVNAVEKICETGFLHMRKMEFPENYHNIWLKCAIEPVKIDVFTKIELSPDWVMKQLGLCNSLQEIIMATNAKNLNIACILNHLSYLQELTIRSSYGFSLVSDLTHPLINLEQLKHLSLTTVKNLNKLDMSVIANLKNLKSLELGDCVDFPCTFGTNILSKLSNLEKLRLEKGTGNCYTFKILETVKNMKHLEQLELVDFDIKIGFDLALKACVNIKKLLIIPTYYSQAAITNRLVLCGAFHLKHTLSHFMWGIIYECMDVTKLFLRRQLGVRVARRYGEVVPIQQISNSNLVEIATFEDIEDNLLRELRTTSVKIVKVFMSDTWKLSITDIVN